MKVKKYIDKVFIAIIIIILIVTGYKIRENKKKVNKALVKETYEESKEILDTVKEDSDIYVHITGCILHEGIYKLKSESRVNDLVELAGGFCDEVDMSKVNLSKKLKDEMKIHIYKINEETKEEENTINDENLSQNGNKLININTANVEELKTLNGIGDSKAKAIIDYRKKTKFIKIEDIMNIKGIGEKMFEKIKDFITVN